MRTIRSKITWLTVSAIVVSIAVATVFGISSIRELGNNNSEKMLTMLCETVGGHGGVICRGRS